MLLWSRGGNLLSPKLQVLASWGKFRRECCGGVASPLRSFLREYEDRPRETHQGCTIDVMDIISSHEKIGMTQDGCEASFLPRGAGTDMVIQGQPLLAHCGKF